VLAAKEIPHQFVEDDSSCALVVPAEYSARAVQELQLYDDENPPVRPPPIKRIEHQNALPGIIAYVSIVCVVAGMAGYSFFGSNWVSAGRIDGELIRNGELWRLFTALTLHASAKHLLGNIAFGVLFGFFAGRLLGSGIAWLAIILAAAAGNAANTFLLESTHRSIGASTAVFAALGLVAGYVWQGKLMAQDRWSYRYGPIVGGLALLMFTGTGGPNTDIGAHLLGFIMGFATGMLLIKFGPVPLDRRSQLRAGICAATLVLASWPIALLV
jgi:membrane associated rhomboid family serine protease